MTQPLLPRAPSSILLVRLSARGDLVFATPLIQALRRTYPEARISWLTSPMAADIVLHNPGLDQVIVWDRRAWVGLLRRGRILELFRTIRAFLKELRSPRHDVALDLHGLLRSGIMTWLSGAPVRIGLGSRELSGLLMTRVLSRDPGDSGRVSSEYVRMAERLGVDVGDFALDVSVSDADDAWVDDMAREHGIGAGYAVVAPFTTRPFKHWPEDRWAPLISGITEEHGLSVVLLGGPGDRAAADRILAAAPGSVVDLVGRTSLSQAVATVRRSALVVGVDTALTHLGSAFARPTVALFGAFLPYTEPPQPRTRVMFANRDAEPLECLPCEAHTTCGGDWTCMKRLELGAVSQAVAGILSEDPSGC